MTERLREEERDGDRNRVRVIDTLFSLLSPGFERAPSYYTRKTLGGGGDPLLFVFIPRHAAREPAPAPPLAAVVIVSSRTRGRDFLRHSVPPRLRGRFMPKTVRTIAVREGTYFLQKQTLHSNR